MDCIRQNYSTRIQEDCVTLICIVQSAGPLFAPHGFEKEKFEEFKNLLNSVQKLRPTSILIRLNIEMRNPQKIIVVCYVWV